MIYVYGIIGFAVGFGFGQMLLFFLLRGVSKEDMLNDKHIQLKYGFLNWSIALLCCYGAVALYRSIF
jgi:ABC-type antimicrobial peptide transport system permease subunit